MTLAPAQDFYELRRDGIGHIARSGSEQWTDYNTHDPGITILEALAYAITELSYRTGFAVEDILATATEPVGDPYQHQAFTTARQILTVNPTTADDLRRLLIDADQVRNAWVRCKTCACDAPFYAWCDNDRLILSHDPSQRSTSAGPAVACNPRGLYDVLLELEADPVYGDLNDRKVTRRLTVDADDRKRPLTIEVRFPAWPLTARDDRRLLGGAIELAGLALNGPKFTPAGLAIADDQELRDHWSDVLYADFEVTLTDGSVITIDNATVRLDGGAAVREKTTLGELVAWLADKTTDEGFLALYRAKLAAVDRAIAAAKSALATHRNLDEDVCHLELVEIDEIAVCADVEVAPSADIDLVQAKIWLAIERYLDPPVDFWSVQDLRNGGTPVEDIFSGPELRNGFLTAEGLAATDLRSELRVSDILNDLVDIDGVISVEHLQLTAYDATGSPVKGQADNREDTNQISASWLLHMRPGHRPRLHRGLSRFLFASNELPFLPLRDEVEDTLIELRSQAARPKLRSAELDLPVPTGRARQMDTYFPVQHSFPLVYGIGPAGLPSTATAERRAQSKQLRAYLLVFEQLLRNAYAQVAHVGDLFSLDPDVTRTYFGTRFTDTDIDGTGELVDPALTDDVFARLLESPSESRERRNRFLDHLLARFGESFAGYAMALTDLEGRTRAAADLIADKLAFLRALPRLGHDRGKAFNRAVAPCDPDNASGLKERINLLFGLPDRTFVYRADKSGAGFRHELRIEERTGPIERFDPGPDADAALNALIVELELTGYHGIWSIEGVGGQLTLTKIAAGQTTREDLLGHHPGDGAAALNRSLVHAQRQKLRDLTSSDDRDTSTWAAHKRAIVAEHLLLRPKFPGDALYPECSDGLCCTCADDPYSFRLTYVMPGWTAPFSTNLAMRGFADRTIQEQTPSHLLGKTCWVGNDGYLSDECDPAIDAIARVLEDRTGDRDAACTCATEIYNLYSAAFKEWFDANRVIHDLSPVIASALAAAFAGVDLAGVSCSGMIDAVTGAAIQAVLIEPFVDIATRGFQFERFEDAWCAWADADAAIDWTDEHLQETVLELLEAGLQDAVEHEEVCTCAATIVAAFGTEFRKWIDGEIASGKTPSANDFAAAGTVTLCQGLALTDNETTARAITDLLTERYRSYVEVSYRLHVLVHALADLRNTYPRATLHDCDVGSDSNPVRLGQTALGSN